MRFVWIDLSCTNCHKTGRSCNHTITRTIISIKQLCNINTTPHTKQHAHTSYLHQLPSCPQSLLQLDTGPVHTLHPYCTSCPSHLLHISVGQCVTSTTLPPVVAVLHKWTIDVDRFLNTYLHTLYTTLTSTL